ncbi:hypothetical protein T265_04625 [Opisthorchis viverrini]|uniref:Uncharacterized protein n=1 Tax=Opisthorchis viverrini TaxID=6198 RepID=A0A074ZN86_OPIVI|nr:hypothetical protein T265_04625 [Opisthorchis viverrini]KER28581.1 hypothetical protein T265_04625 [Opisthorchis viverrini]
MKHEKSRSRWNAWHASHGERTVTTPSSRSEPYSVLSNLRFNYKGSQRTRPDTTRTGQNAKIASNIWMALGYAHPIQKPVVAS